ncbi:MAG: Protein CgeD [Bacteroidota bacterium]|jgi:spore maturation protein CgeD
MNQSLDFTVILTTYNNPEYMEDAIVSVLNQTYDNYELIIADDNSSKPEVYSIIAKYQNNKKVRYFNSNIKNSERLLTARYATQINTAVREFSNGQYICYLADDDYFYPDMLQKVYETINNHKYDVVYCSQNVVDVDKNIRGIRFPGSTLKKGMDVLDHNQVITSRKSFDFVGGWDDSPGCWGGADGYFWARLEAAGYLFYPTDYIEPLQAKRYREKSVQWNIANGLSPVE